MTVVLPQHQPTASTSRPPVRSTEREALRVRGAHDPPFHAGRLSPLATVVAVRHAQADRPTGVDDFDRCPFSLRGRSNAVETLEELVTAYAAEPPAF